MTFAQKVQNAPKNKQGIPNLDAIMPKSITRDVHRLAGQKQRLADIWPGVVCDHTDELIEVRRDNGEMDIAYVCTKCGLER